MFMAVPSFDGVGEMDMNGNKPAWESYDWANEKSNKRRKKERAEKAAAAAMDAHDDATDAPDADASEPKKGKGKKKKEPKVDMRFGSDHYKQQMNDKRYEDRREAKRQKYQALKDAAGDDEGALDDGQGKISGKVLGRRRRAAEKRARLAEQRKADRLAKGLPVDAPAKRLPPKLLVGTAAGVNAARRRDSRPAPGFKGLRRRRARDEREGAEEAGEGGGGGVGASLRRGGRGIVRGGGRGER